MVPPLCLCISLASPSLSLSLTWPPHLMLSPSLTNMCTFLQSVLPFQLFLSTINTSPEAGVSLEVCLRNSPGTSFSAQWCTYPVLLIHVASDETLQHLSLYSTISRANGRGFVAACKLKVASKDSSAPWLEPAHSHTKLNPQRSGSLHAGSKNMRTQATACSSCVVRGTFCLGPIARRNIPQPPRLGRSEPS